MSSEYIKVAFHIKYTYIELFSYLYINRIPLHHSQNELAYKILEAQHDHAPMHPSYYMLPTIALLKAQSLGI